MTMYPANYIIQTGKHISIEVSIAHSEQEPHGPVMFWLNQDIHEIVLSLEDAKEIVLAMKLLRQAMKGMRREAIRARSE